MSSVTVLHKGFIKLGKKVMVSDPCYHVGTWCQGVLENVLPGDYRCSVQLSDEGEWGNRVSAITVIHKNYVNKKIEESIEEFEVGVDSGQAGIYDYNYYVANQESESWYDKVCSLTYDKVIGFTGDCIDGLALVSSSGYGDGGYECFTARNDKNEIVSIRIQYL